MKTIKKSTLKFHQMTTGSLLCLIIVAIWIYQFPTLDQQLREHHAFRQTQTAFQTLSIFEGWGSILRPGMPVLGQPWQVPFEFPLFQQSAALSMKIFSFEIDFANRFTSLIWFSMCVLLVFHISRNFFSQVASIIAAATFAVSPLSVQWSRASLIEYCALFFSLLFLYSSLRLLRTTKRHVLLGTICASSAVLGGLVKSTTFLVYLGIVIAVALMNTKSIDSLRQRKNKLLIIFVSSCSALFSIFLWNGYTDRIKSKSPFTSFLTSRNLQEWNIGTFEQRTDLSNWNIILDRINDLILPLWLLVIASIFLFIIKRNRWILISLLLSVIVTISLFFNLYLVHDYYLVALSPQFALILAGTIENLELSERFNAFRKLSIVSLLLLTAFSFSNQSNYRNLSRGDIPGFDNELVRLSTPDQRIFLAGNGWDPTTMYYIKRKGIALDDRGFTIKALTEMDDLSRYDFYQGPLWFPNVVRLRGWFAPVGQFTLRLADEPSAIPSNLVIGMTSEYTAGQNPSKNNVILDCRVKQSISLESFPLNMQMRINSTGKNVLTFDNHLANSPTGRVLLRQDSRDASIPITQFGCDGVGQISIIW